VLCASVRSCLCNALPCDACMIRVAPTTNRSRCTLRPCTPSSVVISPLNSTLVLSAVVPEALCERESLNKTRTHMHSLVHGLLNRFTPSMIASSGEMGPFIYSDTKPHLPTVKDLSGEVRPLARVYRRVDPHDLRLPTEQRDRMQVQRRLAVMPRTKRSVASSSSAATAAIQATPSPQKRPLEPSTASVEVSQTRTGAHAPPSLYGCVLSHAYASAG
jgi:hypothetical protein